jgi:hypothetical protein
MSFSNNMGCNTKGVMTWGAIIWGAIIIHFNNAGATPHIAISSGVIITRRQTQNFKAVAGLRLRLLQPSSQCEFPVTKSNHCSSYCVPDSFQQ